MQDKFAEICGITQAELEANFQEGIVELEKANEMTHEEALASLKLTYDGYCFSARGKGVYNPFSLLKCMKDSELKYYWFATGTPTFLLKQIQKFHTDITQIDGSVTLESEFDAPTENMHSILPLFYQSGYLTIKAYDKRSRRYTLGFPNEEVKVGLTQMFIPYYVNPDTNATYSACWDICEGLMDGHIETALQAARSYFASIPYQEGTLKDAPTTEGHFTAMLYVMFSFLNFYVYSQVRVAKGRLDILIKTADAVYVMEIKLDGMVDEALQQIEDKGYSIPYETDGKKIIKIGLVFSTTERTITDWKI